MKVVVTGGLGFIGSNLVRDLYKEKHEICVIDNLSSGAVESLDGLDVDPSLCRLTERIGHCNQSSGSIPTTRTGKPEIDKAEAWEVIYHLGIPSSSPMYKDDHKLVGKAVNEMISILEYCRMHNTKLVYASSSSLYNGNKIPWHERMKIKVSDYYTEARYSMERFAELYYKLYGVESTGLRLFSVYGPNEKPKHKYANLVTKYYWLMKYDMSPIIYGNGKQTRDFTYVSDVVRAFRLAANCSGCNIFNVGTGINYTLNDIVYLWNSQLDKDIKPVYKENPIKNYVKDTLADTTLAANKLQFKAKILLREGIKFISESLCPDEEYVRSLPY